MHTGFLGIKSLCTINGLPFASVSFSKISRHDFEYAYCGSLSSSVHANTTSCGLTNAQKQELEKKNQRRQELQDELKEFEEMYENNKKAFFGEALKSKNYADMKIKEIKEKLEELEAEE